MEDLKTNTTQETSTQPEAIDTDAIRVRAEATQYLTNKALKRYAEHPTVDSNGIVMLPSEVNAARHSANH